MWVKKTENEKKIEVRTSKPSLGASVLIFICTLIAIIVPKVTGMSRSIVGKKPIGIDELLPQLPWIFLIAISLSILVYLYQLFFKVKFMKERQTTVVCEKCNTLKLIDGNQLCECGGTFFNIKEMKWIEDNNEIK